MKAERRRSRLAILLLISASLAGIEATPSSGADFGRLLGTVSDTQGNPLIGATVSVVGPAAGGLHGARAVAEQVITDARGRFAIERLAPGLYALRVTAPTRIPALRNGVSIRAGRTTEQSFALGDIFAAVRFQAPQGSVSTWGDDWKWVLRASATTRPILRFREGAKSSQAKIQKPPAAPSQRLVCLMAGGTRREALASDPGFGSVLAYLRPLSRDSDILVAGSMTAAGIQGSSLATAFRRNIVSGDPQVLAIVVHQLSLSDGLQLPADQSGRVLAARGVVVSYSQKRRLGSSLNFAAGFKVDYLNAVGDALMARPSVGLEYQANRSTLVAFRYGGTGPDTEGTLLDRIGVLNAFPRVTLQGYRLRLENFNHAGLSLNRRLGQASRIEFEVYHDAFQNAAVLGAGGNGLLAEFAGNVLPNPVAGGVILNAGNYGSSGFRTVYSRSLGSHLATSLAYFTGSALAITPGGALGSGVTSSFAAILRPERTQSIAGKVSAEVPRSKTEIVTSYEWMQPGRVTSVDPFGQAALQIQPYLGVRIRQPLPALAFLPAHIEALADFRNLLAEGYVPVSRSGEKPLVLTSGYRCFRGGFSVQF